ncbi:MAG: hypothetical protein JW717_07045 [Marinilabiliaceae bacterium]|nr:hypothetical protein [Marinilabiliaceae bacterium]
MIKINLSNTINLLSGLIRYNFKVIFGNKFIYFVGGSILFYLLVAAINIFSNESSIVIEDVFNMHIFPAMLLISFPTIFGIQNDADARMLEIIFGIPNYRYKVYLVRIFMILMLVIIYLLILSLLSNFLLIQFNMVQMVFRLLPVVVFFGMLGFSFSTVVRNGNGTVVVVVVIALFCWILTNFLEYSKWNVFLNPFKSPSDMSQLVWETVVYQNRIILGVMSLILILWGMLNLQHRERFMK